MNIIPISAHPVQTSSVPGATGASSASASFQNLFEDALEELNQANAQKEADTIDLALGNTDDIAAITANSLKAEVSLQLLVQMRNKLLEGYQEIMRLNI